MVGTAAEGAGGGVTTGARITGRGGEMLGRAVVAARAGGTGARRPGPELSADGPGVAGGDTAAGSSDGTRRSSILGFSAGGRSSVGAVSVR